MSQGYSDLKIALKDVSQFGACLGFEYRVNPANGRRGYVDLKIFGGKNSLIFSKKLQAAAEGKKWQHYQESIPPRASKDDISMDWHAIFGDVRGDIKEIDIDDIYIQGGLCNKNGGPPPPSDQQERTNLPR